MKRHRIRFNDVIVDNSTAYHELALSLYDIKNMKNKISNDRFSFGLRSYLDALEGMLNKVIIKGTYGDINLKELETLESYLKRERKKIYEEIGYYSSIKNEVSKIVTNLEAKVEIYTSSLKRLVIAKEKAAKEAAEREKAAKKAAEKIKEESRKGMKEFNGKLSQLRKEANQTFNEFRKNNLKSKGYIGAGLAGIGLVGAGTAYLINRYKKNKKDRMFTDHKSLPWASKYQKTQKIRFTDYSEPDASNTKKMIGEAVRLLKDVRSEHPVFSDISSVLLKILGAIGAISAGLRVVGSFTGWSLGSIGRMNLSPGELEKLKEEIKNVEKATIEAKKQSKILGALSQKSLSLMKATASPKLFLLTGLLKAIVVGVASYIAFAIAKVMQTKKTIEVPND